MFHSISKEFKTTTYLSVDQMAARECLFTIVCSAMIQDGNGNGNINLCLSMSQKVVQPKLFILVLILVAVHGRILQIRICWTLILLCTFKYRRLNTHDYCRNVIWNALSRLERNIHLIVI